MLRRVVSGGRCCRAGGGGWELARLEERERERGNTGSKPGWAASAAAAEAEGALMLCAMHVLYGCVWDESTAPSRT